MTDPALTSADIRRAVVASLIGNGLEWFDFIAYSLLAPVLSDVLFPRTDPAAARLLFWATFALGYFVRPFGGILFARYADRAGRRAALTALILLMAGGTALLAATPSYATAGLAAPIIAITARIIQSLSIGGEYASATAMLVEYAAPGRAFRFGALQSTAQSIGLVLACLTLYGLTVSLDAEQMRAWGWRVPFVMGAFVGPIGFYIRRRVHESPVFLRLAERHAVARAPLRDVLRHHGRAVALGIAIIVPLTGTTYLWNSYMRDYSTHVLHLPPTTALLSTALLQTFIGAAYWPAGILADRLGWRRLYFASVAILGLASVPLLSFLLAAPSPGRLFLVQGLALSTGIAASACVSGLLARQFPAPMRSTGMAVSYNVSVALFGGTAPLIVTWLIETTGDPRMPGFYLAVASALSLACVAALAPRERTDGDHAALAPEPVGS